ncbi:hypothetical protein JT358_09765 [Micrococcales bacterium 31B]|nr:hypothetical protein [Micrococcales bacterium 31B]
MSEKKKPRRGVISIPAAGASLATSEEITVKVGGETRTVRLNLREMAQRVYEQKRVRDGARSLRTS